MLKYLAKISMDILPSVLATIIGAYIVNHYINAKPAADAPAAVVAPAQAGSDGKPTDTANLPAPGVKAKGVAEKSVSEKGVDKVAAEKPADHQPATETKAADVAPAETGPRGRNSAREKAAAKSNPAVTAPAAAPVVEANSAPAATPDANDLARAAIERLRKSPEGKAAEKAAEARSPETKSVETKPVERTPEPAVREAARTPEAPRTISAEQSMVRPLPPPITVSTPLPEAYGNSGSSPSYTSSVGNDDPNRMTPPADIPVPMIAPPLDLRADAGGAMPRPKKTNVADEMLSGMKSMFHSVLPKSATPD
ncbi:hypothetical protein J4G43_009820 [Bradyrhizobium barranii subsp. barranii]|uniref:Uncharacterized protein n=1 Tax=Bradyrhizobium barranii subsp. barranii TaxID=2823807 RepID=A0A939M1T8_9BRAD|nr:hypothetical protein [Bradyrhizobium barranii]UEM14512.1 hypothetical protein J4G43_009820 [Bradyrhizobium barranii subsp. barranii]